MWAFFCATIWFLTNAAKGYYINLWHFGFKEWDAAVDALVRCAWADPLSSLFGRPSAEHSFCRHLYNYYWTVLLWLGADLEPAPWFLPKPWVSIAENLQKACGTRWCDCFPTWALFRGKRPHRLGTEFVSRPFYRIGQIEILRNRFDSAAPYSVRCLRVFG